MKVGDRIQTRDLQWNHRGFITAVDDDDPAAPYTICWDSGAVFGGYSDRDVILIPPLTQLAEAAS